MKQGNTFLGTEKISTLLKNFAIPSIIAMLVSALYNIVDQFFIGRSVGQLGNAATNVVFPLNTSCTALALLVGIGGSAIFNIAMGKGDRKRATYYFGNAVTMLLGLGFLLCVVTQIFLTDILIFFGSPGDVLEYAKEYTRIIAIGFPFLLLSIGGGHLIRADGSPKFAMICNLVGAIINIVLDAVFVFGLQMAMSGAALATIIGQIVAAVMVINYIRNCHSIQLKAKHFKIQWQYVSQTMALGAGPFSNQMAMMVVQIVLNNSLTYYGRNSSYGESVPLAVVGIISKVNMLYMSVVIGLSQGMQPIASYNFGAGKYDRVKEVFKLVIKCGLVASVISFMMFQILPRQIISLFGKGSEDYYNFAIKYFRIFLFFTFINCVQPASSTFFTAIGKAGKGAFLSLTRQTIFLLPLIIIFPFIVGIDGIMYAGPVADFMAAVISVYMVKREFKRLEILKCNDSET